MPQFNTQSLLPDTASAARVVVGMSGGVDSSLSAKLLIDQGYQVSGLFMKNWEEDDGSAYCTAKQDLADAQAVCDHLDIKLEQANFSAEYWDHVFSQCLAEYKAGRTPNPDILCNREIKFNLFREYAEMLGADYIATGHYARLHHSRAGSVQLLKGLDSDKDQSYFLQSVSAKQLSRCIFPLGDLKKSLVRSLAKQYGLPTFAKKDSTGICFIGERRFKDFLSQYIPARPGPIKTTAGKVIGEHSGVMFHTLGQRQGLGIGGIRNMTDAAWYVVRKELAGNTLIVAQGQHHPLLYSKAMRCHHIAWVDGVGAILPQTPAVKTLAVKTLAVKTRYRQPDQACTLSKTAAGYEIRFATPQRAVTPGQWACFYAGDVCLGGGIIESTSPADLSADPSARARMDRN